MDMMPRVGSCTNATDPMSIQSRVFCGNLNTFQLTKEQVEVIFARYGNITGISMHKGYAFVQYQTPSDARRAVSCEDGKTYANQMIDVNLAAEPKIHNRTISKPKPMNMNMSMNMNMNMNMPNMMGPNMMGQGPMRKRALSQGEQWPNPMQEQCFGGSLPMPQNMGQMNRMGGGMPGMKRSRPNIQPQKPQNSTQKRGKSGFPAGSAPTAAALPQPKPVTVTKYHTPDILICGNCKQQFPDMEHMEAHKRHPCILRFTCKCHVAKSDFPEPDQWTCATCNAVFDTCWDLCRHCQNGHGAAIYVDPRAQRTAKANGTTSKKNESKDDEEALLEDDDDKKVDKMEEDEPEATESGDQGNGDNDDLSAQAFENGTIVDES